MADAAKKKKVAAAPATKKDAKAPKAAVVDKASVAAAAPAVTPAPSPAPTAPATHDFEAGMLFSK
jgi:hypothetical protein